MKKILVLLIFLIFTRGVFALTLEGNVSYTVESARSITFENVRAELPLSMVLSWYEQKAVCILLTLLHLGIKNIYLGPTLPAFISANVLDILVKNYNISPISTPEKDLEKILAR